MVHEWHSGDHVCVMSPVLQALCLCFLAWPNLSRYPVVFLLRKPLWGIMGVPWMCWLMSALIFTFCIERPQGKWEMLALAAPPRCYAMPAPHSHSTCPASWMRGNTILVGRPWACPVELLWYRDQKSSARVIALLHLWETACVEHVRGVYFPVKVDVNLEVDLWGHQGSHIHV